MWTLKALLHMTRFGRQNVQNLLERHGALTDIPPIKLGAGPRHYTRANALEIVFRTALADAGLSHSAAKRIAAVWLKEEATGTLRPFWALNPAAVDRDGGTHTGEGFSNEELGIIDWGATFAEDVPGGYAGEARAGEEEWMAATILLINVRELVRRVDAAAEAPEAGE